MRFIVLLFSAVIVLSCSPANKLSTEQSHRLLDIAYGSFESSKMDVYLPENRTREAPFVVIIHGGGWVAGDKKSDRGSQQFFMERGIASANLNYRFVDSFNIHYPEMLRDIDSAVSYCIQQSKNWNTRRNNFVFMGASAGGHLALLYPYLNPLVKVDAIIAECAPVDFTDRSTLDHTIEKGLLGIIEMMAGAFYIPGEPVSPKFAESSPLMHIKNIPTLIVHGTSDYIVPYSEAVKLHSRLKEKNIPVKLITLEGAGHDLNFRDRPTRDMVYDGILEWIRKHSG